MSSDVELITSGAKKAGRAISDTVYVTILIIAFIFGVVGAAVIDHCSPPFEYKVYTTSDGYDEVFKKDENGEWKKDNTGVVLKMKGR